MLLYSKLKFHFISVKCLAKCRFFYWCCCISLCKASLMVGRKCLWNLYNSVYCLLCECFHYSLGANSNWTWFYVWFWCVNGDKVEWRCKHSSITSKMSPKQSIFFWIDWTIRLVATCVWCFVVFLFHIKTYTCNQYAIFFR